MRRALVLLVAVSTAAAIGATVAAAAGGAAAPTVTVRSSDYGRIVFDGRGRALYAFTSDRRGRATCNGACAAAWPPYLVRGRFRAGAGAQAGLIGSVRRADGSRQVTYAGKPLYYYVGDRRPGEVRCQDVFHFGGTWLVVRPSGRLVR